jgi:hypothetical protein
LTWSEDQKVWVEYTPPKYKCGTHGEHPHWMHVMLPGEAEHPGYCLMCMIDFLNRQSIGKVMLKEGTHETAAATTT